MGFSSIFPPLAFCLLSRRFHYLHPPNLLLYCFIFLSYSYFLVVLVFLFSDEAFFANGSIIFSYNFEWTHSMLFSGFLLSPVLSFIYLFIYLFFCCCSCFSCFDIGILFCLFYSFYVMLEFFSQYLVILSCPSMK